MSAAGDGADAVGVAVDCRAIAVPLHLKSPVGTSRQPSEIKRPDPLASMPVLGANLLPWAIGTGPCFGGRMVGVLNDDAGVICVEGASSGRLDPICLTLLRL